MAERIRCEPEPPLHTSTKTQKSADVSLFPLDFWEPQSGTELDT